MSINIDFANYCCELLRGAGPCIAKRMFGGYSISTDGLTIAILADLGDGEKLWLKGDDNTRNRYDAAGCKIFTYLMKGVPRSMNFFSSPEEAMDSPDAMRPWAILALECAVWAQAGKPATVRKKAISKPKGLDVFQPHFCSPGMRLQALAVGQFGCDLAQYLSTRFADFNNA